MAEPDRVERMWGNLDDVQVDREISLSRRWSHNQREWPHHRADYVKAVHELTRLKERRAEARKSVPHGERWKAEHEKAANEQGWTLREEDGTFSIARHPRSLEFRHDEAALRHVERRAQQGDTIAVVALEVHEHFRGRAMRREEAEEAYGLGMEAEDEIDNPYEPEDQRHDAWERGREHRPQGMAR